MSVTLQQATKDNTPTPNTERRRNGVIMGLAVMLVILLISLPGMSKIALLLPLIIIGGFWLNKTVQQPGKDGGDTILFSSSCIVITEAGIPKRYETSDLSQIVLHADLVKLPKSGLYGPIEWDFSLIDGSIVSRKCIVRPMEYADLVYAITQWYKLGITVTETMGAEKRPALLLRTQALYGAKQLQETKAELGIS